MKPYFGYIRVSTQKQGQQGSSLQEQKSAIQAYAARYDLTITGWFEERETAAKQGRRVFSRMLAELNKGRAVGIIVHKIDRSARNLQDWAGLGELIDRGIDVHFAHEKLDLNSRGGRLTADLLAVVAADYIRNLKDEVRKGFYGRLKQGFYPLPAPIGYLDNGKAKAKTFDPIRAPLVRQMFELYASGAYNLDGLSEEMKRRGLRRRGGAALSRTGIAHVLHNPFYIGIIKIGRTGETFAGVHEPLISKAVFDRVQAILSGRSYPHVIKHGFTYRRLIKCGRCGKSLVGERQKGRAYYRCHSTSCRGTSLREDAIEDEIQTLLERLVFSPAELAELRGLIEEERANASAREADARIKAQCALGAVEDRLARLTDAFLDGSIDKDLFESRKSALIAQRASLRDQAAAQTEDPVDSLLEKLELGNTAQLRFASTFSDEKRETVENITSNLVADGKSLAITPRFPFDEIEKWRISNDGGPRRSGLRTLGRAELEELLRLTMSQTSGSPRSPQCRTST